MNTFLYLYTISMVLEANSYWSFSVQLLQWTHNLKRKIKLRNKNFITNYISIIILNITLEGLSFVKCYAHSSDVYRNCIKMNLFAIISIKKKTNFVNEVCVSKPNNSKCPLFYVYKKYNKTEAISIYSCLSLNHRFTFFFF